MVNVHIDKYSESLIIKCTRNTAIPTLKMLMRASSRSGTQIGMVYRLYLKTKHAEQLLLFHITV